MGGEAVRLGLIAHVNRSGSTFLANELSKHPQICVCPEAPGPMKLVLSAPASALSDSSPSHRLRRVLEDDPKMKAWGFTSHEIDEILRGSTYLDAFWRMLRLFRDKRKPDARTVVVKGVIFLRLLTVPQGPLQLGENVRLLVLIRDGRAVYSSQKRSLSTNSGRPMQVSPVRAAVHWKQFVERAARLDPAFATVLRYEDLIQAPPQTIGRALHGLGIGQGTPPLATRGELVDLIPEEQQRLHTRVGGAPDLERIGVWRRELTEEEAALFERVAGNMLMKHGYELVDPVIPWSRLMATRARYAVLGNMHRARNWLMRRRRRRKLGY